MKAMAFRDPHLFDKQIIDHGAPFYKDYLTVRQAQCWYAHHHLQWSSIRVGRALKISPSTVRVILRNVRKVAVEIPGALNLLYRSAH